MGRAPCCESTGLKRGPWDTEEDQILVAYIQRYGHANWRNLPKQAGLQRCGKSCRLRWMNYLRPDIKRGNFTEEEEDAIIHLHQMLGNRWSAIAARLPGRTDNEIKNVWHTHLKKRLERSTTSGGPQAQKKNTYTNNKSTSTARTVENLQMHPAQAMIIPVPMAPSNSPTQSSRSSSSELSSYCPLSLNTVDSPSSASTGAATVEIYGSNCGAINIVDEYLAEEMMTMTTTTMPNLDEYESCFLPIDMDPIHSQESLLMQCDQRQDGEEDIDDFWLKMLMEAEATADMPHQLVVDHLFSS